MRNRKHRRMRSRGSVVSTFALTLVPMLGFVSMGVDWGQISVAEFAVRAAADEAALVAASTLSHRPKTQEAIDAAYALAVERANQYSAIMGLNNLVFALEELNFGFYTPESGWSTSIPAGEVPNAVEVVVSTEIELSFAVLFGIPSIKVTKHTKAGASLIRARAPDLVIVQDVTPSMNATDIAKSKAANKALVECIETYAHPTTRGAFVTFGNIDRTVLDLTSYEDAPNALYNAVAANAPLNAYSNSGLCAGGGCTSHSAGMYAAVDILDNASEPPEGVGQAIIFITDGAPYTNNSGCTSVASSSTMATPYQNWLVGDSSTRCDQLAAQTTVSACNNAGGRWVSGSTPPCKPSDNGAEGTSTMVPGVCSISGYTTEARCESNGGIWRNPANTAPNPSSYTRWTEEAKLLAENGKWGPIDIYAVYYSDGASSTYSHDNLWFLHNHIISGDGAELGVLDAPTGGDLVDALEELCRSYTVGTPGLIE